MMHVARGKFFLFFIGIIAGCASCENQKASTADQRYYYYPKTNAYYDTKSLEYIYSLDSGRTWVKMKTPADLTPSPALGEKIIIKETEDDIWYENETHRNMYGGILYNVITRDTLLLTDNNRNNEIKKAPVKTDSMDESPKKKRNIFQRIFGKKKN